MFKARIKIIFISVNNEKQILQAPTLPKHIKETMK